MSTSITTDVSNYGAQGYGDLSYSMKALTCLLVETARPTIIDEGDVILKVTGSTICGSDLHLFYEAILDLQKGDILGHEFCGIIVSVGPAVKNVKVGDRVVASFQIACGQCYYCKKNLSLMCERTNSSEDASQLYGRRTAGMFGYSHFIGGFAGGVILIDGGHGKWRLDFVKKLLPKLETIEYTNLPKGESVTSTLKKMCDGRGPDVAIECAAGMETDTSELINEMITSVRGFGRCGITGVYAGYCNHFNVGSLMETGICLIGNGQAPVQKYWKDLLKYAQQEKIHPLHMVTHRFKLEDMETVYDLFNKRDLGMQKVFVQTKFSAPPARGSPLLTEL
ncbi:hypothetical protein DTO012A9_9874 [Penicillium roqueforti]|nr:hypothetical protein CBS147310_9703 [Penicillium roqueforti]KAI3223081.1 hypothetical protein DTO012A9_9874 [Penicillium roqueforti]